MICFTFINQHLNITETRKSWLVSLYWTFYQKDIIVIVTNHCLIKIWIIQLASKLILFLPPLFPLFFLLFYKQSQRRLNETYGGGMGSFVLVTIIISFLQMRSRNLAYRKVQQSWNLGALLLEFFVLYGHTFNYVHTGISISKGGFYFEKLCRPGWFNPVR